MMSYSRITSVLGSRNPISGTLSKAPSVSGVDSRPDDGENRDLDDNLNSVGNTLCPMGGSASKNNPPKGGGTDVDLVSTRRDGLASDIRDGYLDVPDHMGANRGGIPSGERLVRFVGEGISEVLEHGLDKIRRDVPDHMGVDCGMPLGERKLVRSVGKSTPEDVENVLDKIKRDVPDHMGVDCGMPSGERKLVRSVGKGTPEDVENVLDTTDHMNADRGSPSSGERFVRSVGKGDPDNVLDRIKPILKSVVNRIQALESQLDKQKENLDDLPHREVEKSNSDDGLGIMEPRRGDNSTMVSISVTNSMSISNVFTAPIHAPVSIVSNAVTAPIHAMSITTGTPVVGGHATDLGLEEVVMGGSDPEAERALKAQKKRVAGRARKERRRAAKRATEKEDAESITVAVETERARDGAIAIEAAKDDGATVYANALTASNENSPLALVSEMQVARPHVGSPVPGYSRLHYHTYGAFLLVADDGRATEVSSQHLRSCIRFANEAKGARPGQSLRFVQPWGYRELAEALNEDVQNLGSGACYLFPILDGSDIKIFTREHNPTIIDFPEDSDTERAMYTMDRLGHNVDPNVYKYLALAVACNSLGLDWGGFGGRVPDGRKRGGRSSGQFGASLHERGGGSAGQGAYRGGYEHRGHRSHPY